MKQYCKLFDSVSLCLSKGLGAPIGSVLVGSSVEFIQKAKHFRKCFGGGWRQAGGLAAAGLYAIQNQWERMRLDHFRTSRIDEVLKELKLCSCVWKTETNMCWMDTSRYEVLDQSDSGHVSKRPLVMEDIAIALRKVGLVVFGGKVTQGRIVLHLDIDDEAVDILIHSLRKLIQDGTVVLKMDVRKLY